MSIRPFLVGSGGAGGAMQRSLSVVGLGHPELEILPTVLLKRDQPLKTVELVNGKTPAGETAVLFIANPHGLHAQYIEDADATGFRYVVTEKPVCVSLSEIQQLRSVSANVSVCHGYRQMWGPQQIKAMIRSGELGELISIEGRYWQSSAAQTALSGEHRPNWKNDPALSGSFDTYLDLGAHWADLMFFFSRATSDKVSTWLNYSNSEAPHRDTHVHLGIEFSNGVRTWGSISKNVHGAGNDLSLTLIGSKRSVSWSFDTPDRLSIGMGSGSQIVSRIRGTGGGSGQAPFHGLGWLEGYVEIICQALYAAQDKPAKPIPTLQESLTVLEALLKAAPQDK